MTSKQLFKLIPQSKVAANDSRKRPSENIHAASPVKFVPMLRWSCGHWCLEGNLYLQKQYRSGASSIGVKGGTLGVKAGRLSKLLRFVESKNVTLNSIDEPTFCKFIESLDELQVSKQWKKGRKNSDTTQSEIALEAISFLRWFSEVFYYNIFGTGGIQISEKETSTGPKNRRKSRIIISHHKMPGFSEKRHRLAVDDSDIELLYDAAYRLYKKSPLPSWQKNFIHERRRAMIGALVQTGGRRTELSLMTTATVKLALAASQMGDDGVRGDATLTLTTLKHKRLDYRKIGVTDTGIHPFRRYLDLRETVIRKTCGAANDSQILFVSARYGTPLNEQTIDSEFQTLRKEAGIDYQVVPHMFRHRKIVNVIIELVLQYDILSKTDFKVRLITQDDIKIPVMQVSGHLSEEGLDWYITHAFKVINQVDRVRAAGRRHNLMQDFKAEYERIERSAGRPLSDAERGMAMAPFLAKMYSDLKDLDDQEGSNKNKGAKE
ncbi:tyrosine-type recombinase/integrase [Paraburkholderia sp. EG285A]|uniref:tyrosine-type recombinase/integrase n=1 Tax=Paraburkholderia sp. EG285A TaxID=3237009 RepID=UPI0034D2963F